MEPQTEDPVWGRTALVRACYEVLLRRPAEDGGVVARHALAHASPASMLADFLGSDEFRDGQRRASGLRRLGRIGGPAVPGALRILLFGAYGNGNLGDAAQAEAVAGLIRAVVRRPLDICATSWMALDSYPFPLESLAGPDTVVEPAVLDGFDLLLLAGGGLFAPIHFPLLEPEWVTYLLRSGLPYGFFGLGSLQDDTGVAEDWRRLTAGAAFVSVREQASLGTMPPAYWMPDPVLIAGLRAGGGVPRHTPPGARPLCIVKQPAHAMEAHFLDAVAKPGRPVDLVMMEPRQDGVLVDRFPGLRPVGSMAELVARCAAASMVVSARYHGCIAALLAGVPCVGLGPGKNARLFESLGAPERFLADHGALEAAMPGGFGPLPATAFEPLRRAADQSLRALAAMIEAMPRRR